MLRCFRWIFSWFVVAFVVALLDAGENVFLAPFADVTLGCGLGELGAREFLVHADGVFDEDAGDGHRGGEVFVVAEEG